MKREMKQLEKAQSDLLKLQEKEDEVVKTAADKAEKRFKAVYGARIKGLQAQIKHLTDSIDGQS